VIQDHSIALAFDHSRRVMLRQKDRVPPVGHCLFWFAGLAPHRNHTKTESPMKKVILLLFLAEELSSSARNSDPQQSNMNIQLLAINYHDMSCNTTMLKTVNK
jgi:hypothetical protein